jgi:hypothetical protein
VVTLIVRELESGDDAPCLTWVVVLDRGLQVLAEGIGLPQLAPKPATEADLRRALYRLEAHSASCSTTKPSRS